MANRILTSAFITFFAATALAGGTAIETTSKEMKQVAPMPTTDFSWTGFYVGARAGYGWHDGTIDAQLLPHELVTLVPRTANNDADGFVGGGEVGYNWQFSRFVLGVESDFSGSDISGSSDSQVRFAPSQFVGREPVSHDVHWFGTARGRIGFTVTPRVLLYGTGGVAVADIEQSAGVILIPVARYLETRSETETGWTAGGGIEIALTPHWSVKAEYLYCDFGNQSLTAFSQPRIENYRVRYDYDTQFHTIVGGLNFKF